MTETDIQEKTDNQVETAGGGIVYVIDDNAEVRKSLHFAMRSTGFTVWPFGSPEDFLESVSGLTPAPILLDIRMPKIDGIELLALLRERSVDWPVIMMTAHGDVPVAVAAMKNGALDFLEKPFSIEQLEVLLVDAYARLASVIMTTEQRRKAEEAFALLTGREKQIALSLGSGRTSKQIGEHLGISPRTVEVHRASALRKLNFGTTAEAVKFLTEAGIN